MEFDDDLWEHLLHSHQTRPSSRFSALRVSDAKTSDDRGPRQMLLQINRGDCRPGKSPKRCQAYAGVYFQVI